MPSPALEYADFAIGEWSVTVATTFGPRILGITKGSSPNPLAVLEDTVTIERADGPPYLFRGGHRVWAAPEVPSISHAPDDHTCQVAAGDEHLEVVAPADAAGLVKQIEVNLEDDRLVVSHSLENRRPNSLDISVWAITQFRLGGAALLPLGSEGQGNGWQADRSVVLWPYTQLDDPRLSWRAQGVEISAEPGPRLKLGTTPDPKRLGYSFDGYLFTKTIAPLGEGTYPDHGAVGQVFVDDNFLELESVGPIVSLGPGEATSSTEIWDIVPCRDQVMAWEMIR